MIHALFAITLFFHSTHFSMPSTGSGSGPAISVELYRSQAASDAVLDKIDTPSEDLPITGNEGVANQTLSPPGPGMNPDRGIVLPPQEAPYFPSGSVDSKPYPKVPVVIPFPEGALPKQKIAAILVLYIGMDGQIDRVEVEQSELPPVFEKAALDAFRQASMQPAIKDGSPVRARMKIQVEFEAP